MGDDVNQQIDGDWTALQDKAIYNRTDDICTLISHSLLAEQGSER